MGQHLEIQLARRGTVEITTRYSNFVCQCGALLREGTYSAGAGAFNRLCL